MLQNNICTDIDCPYSKCINDFEIAKYIVSFGSICIIFSSLTMVYLIYIVYKELTSGKEEEEIEGTEGTATEEEKKTIKQ
jgi:threonine/homoserine/homoserine lactone efflux protein